MHRADVKDTHGSNTKLKKLINNFKISNFYDCFQKTYEWYVKIILKNYRMHREVNLVFGGSGL